MNSRFEKEPVEWVAWVVPVIFFTAMVCLFGIIAKDSNRAAMKRGTYESDPKKYCTELYSDTWARSVPAKCLKYFVN